MNGLALPRLGRGPALLLALSLVLTVDLLYQLLAPAPQFHPDPTPIALAPATTTGPAFTPPPPANFAELDERPIFSPERKPLQSLTDFNVSEAGAPSNITLVGIIMGAGQQIAILKTGPGPAQNVSVGGEIDGWQVTRIESSYIVLHQDSTGQDVKLPLHFGDHAAGQPATQGPQTGTADGGPNRQ